LPNTPSSVSSNSSVALVVLAELAGLVADRLEQLGDRRVLLLDAARRSRDADRGHSRANRHLPHQEGGAAGGAARLAVVIGEDAAFLGDAVDVGRHAQHPVGVGADIPDADVVAPMTRMLGLPLGMMLSSCRGTFHTFSHRSRSGSTGEDPESTVD
jgi:hypothetical protein